MYVFSNQRCQTAEHKLAACEAIMLTTYISICLRPCMLAFDLAGQNAMPDVSYGIYDVANVVFPHAVCDTI